MEVKTDTQKAKADFITGSCKWQIICNDLQASFSLTQQITVVFQDTERFLAARAVFPTLPSLVGGYVTAHTPLSGLLCTTARVAEEMLVAMSSSYGIFTHQYTLWNPEALC